MPELPEVETVVRGLRAFLPGREIVHASLRPRDLYRSGSASVKRLVGRKIAGVERVGKAIRAVLEPANGQADITLVVHLGMTGRLQLASRPAPSKHLHGRLRLDDGTELHYYDPRRFGFFYVGKSDGLRDALNIGPDPFEYKPAAFAAVLERRSAPIKSLLLNQKIISGLGNIYVDESLFYAGVNPFTPAHDVVPDASALLKTIRALLRRAIRLGGTTFRDYRKVDGSKGGYQGRLAVYDRSGRPCILCDAAIERTVLGGRGTHYCPNCQKGDASL